MAKVLVTDGSERSALAVVRSLGRAGHHVLVADRRVSSLAGASRHARGEVRLPDPLGPAGEYSSRLLEAIGRNRPDVLIPVTEASLLQVLPLRDRLEGVLLPFPDAGSFRRISDKRAVLREAERTGIEVPGQWVVSEPGDLPPGGFTGDDLPLVAKPSRSVVGTGEGRQETGVVHIPSLPELEPRLADLPAQAYPVLLQQYVPGPGIGIFLLRWDGEYLASFAHRRIREKPPSGGVSVYRESVRADPSLLEKSRALLDRFDWRGVAMIEFKVDRTSATPYLMEINGRFWGSLQLAVDAGVDFPRLLVEAATGAGPTPVHGFRVGVRSRWLWGDVDHLIARLRHRSERQLLPEGPRGRGSAILDFLRVSRGDRLEVLRLNDPMPFLRETREWVRSALA